MSARKATAEDADAIAQMLALALFEDPPNRWAFPDEARRQEILPSFIRVFVDASIRENEAYTVDERVAACLWFPPGWELTEDEAISFEAAIRRAAGEYADSGPLTIVGLMTEHHPTEAHYYLAFAGTLPGHQGKGIGSALIRTVLDRCDNDRVPAYLEASAERNRRLYERLGFQIRVRIDLPDGPPMWGMWRDPID